MNCGDRPSERYAALISGGELMPDAAQQGLVLEFDALTAELIERGTETRVRSLANRIFGKREPPVRGIYLWGPVGRGKTFLMDLFYQSLGEQSKQRLHFHRFMQRIHEGLTELAGIRDPLGVLARQIGKQTRVLCIDEFYVTDIGDAMLLAELLKALIAQGITLVATSNLAPEDLYENGLQRRRFLPAIDLMREHMRVIAIEAGEDFRMRLLKDAGTYHTPNDEEADQRILRSFERLTDEPIEEDVDVEILHRIIRARRVSGGVAMFGFHDLCETARSQNDYIELARLYHTMIVTNVPVMNAKSESPARRFIALVDELYDRSVNLIVSAEVQVEGLYVGEQHSKEFERCASRLIEMRSVEYMERMHRG